MGLSACASGGSNSSAPAAAPIGNQTKVGSISYGGTYTVAPGGTAIIHGARQGCDSAPAIETVGFKQSPSQGTIYDAGISSRKSGSCGKVVPLRAVGYRANDDFSGTDKIIFGGGAEVTIKSP